MTEEIIIIAKILTPLQLAHKKYYEKMKHNELYIIKRQAVAKKHYDKIKNTEEYKMMASIRGKEYYKKTKDSILFPNILV